MADYSDHDARADDERPSRFVQLLKNQRAAAEAAASEGDELNVLKEKVRILREVVTRAQTELDEAEEKLEHLKWDIPEPEDESIIGFSLQYTESSDMYRYAAIRVGDRWFFTGSTCPTKGVTWETLIDQFKGAFLVKGPILVYDGTPGHSSYVELQRKTR